MQRDNEIYFKTSTLRRGEMGFSRNSKPRPETPPQPRPTPFPRRDTPPRCAA